MKTIVLNRKIQAKTLVDEIIDSIKSSNEVVVNPLDSEFIGQAMSAIDSAKNILIKNNISIIIKPVVEEIKTNTDKVRTTIIFKIKPEPYIIEIAYLRDDFRYSCIN